MDKYGHGLRPWALAAFLAVATACGSGSSPGASTPSLSVGAPGQCSAVTPQAPCILSYAPFPASLSVGTAAVVTPTLWSGGGTATNWTITPALPAGLSFATTTGIITGTPSAVAATAVYSVQASNGSGSSNVFQIPLAVAVRPTGIAYPTTRAIYLVQQAIAPNVPTLTAGSAPTWVVSPALPAGLSLDPGTGAITGTPTAASPPANYAVTASNSSGSSTAVVNVTVNPFSIAGPASQAVPLGTATSFSVTVTGGTPPFRYEWHYGNLVSSGASSTYPTGATTLDVGGWLAWVKVTDGAGLVGYSSQASLTFSDVARYAYVASELDQVVSTYAVDSRTGRLAYVASTPAQGAATSLAIDPSGGTLHAAAGWVQSFGIQRDGSLTVGAHHDVGKLVNTVVVKPATSTGPALFATTTSQFVFPFSIGAGGALTPLPAAFTGFPGTDYDQGQSHLAVDPSGTFAYATNIWTNDISMFAVDQQGNLSPSPAPVTAAGANPQDIVLDRTGKFAWVANGDDGTVQGYTVTPGPGPSAGTLAKIGSGGLVTSVRNPSGLALHPTLNVLYTVANGGNEIFALSYNPTTGAIGVFQGEGAGVTPMRLAVDPAGRFAYAVNYGYSQNRRFLDSTLSLYAVNPSTGSLSSVVPATAPARQGPRDMTMTTGGPAVCSPLRAYVANLADPNGGPGQGSISQFAVDPDGALFQLPVFASAGVEPSSIVALPGGRFAYATNLHSATVSQYAVDPRTGNLYPLPNPTVPTGLDPVAIAFDPLGRFAYVANSGDGTLSQYAVGNDGQLAVIPNAPSTVALPKGAIPSALATDRLGAFVYVTDRANNTVLAYSVGSGVSQPAGALQYLSGQNVWNRPLGLVVSPANDAVYTVASASNLLVRLGIAANGTLGGPANYSVDQEPVAVAIHPTGPWVYVVDGQTRRIWQFTVGSSGALTRGASQPTGAGPYDVQVDCGGTLAYVANYLDGTISGYAIDPTSGALTPIGTWGSGSMAAQGSSFLSGPVSISLLGGWR